MTTEYLTRNKLPSIAYVKSEGDPDKPGVMFLGGFRSDMQGTKATYLEKTCQERGQNFIRFDYSGHGESEGDFKDGTISLWTQDALDILDHKTNGPIILVGSSMGGWIALLLALKRKTRVAGLIGLAAAPDFTRVIESRMSAEHNEAIARQGNFDLDNDYSPDPYPITAKLLEDGRQNALLNDDIDINIPVRLIQGKKDTDVDWETAEHIKQAIAGSDVEVTLLKDSDHRLSGDEELELIDSKIVELSGY